MVRSRLETPVGRGERFESRATREEQIEKRLNPEDERLPGNFLWGDNLVAAGARNWNRFSLWMNTLDDRHAADEAARRATVASAYENMLSNRTSEYNSRLSHHSQAIGRLENRRGLWNAPIGRQTNALQIRYHAWRERVNEHKVDKLEAKATRAKTRAELAEADRKYFDSRVTERVNGMTNRWQSYLNTIHNSKSAAEVRLQELGETIAQHEAFIRDQQALIERLAAGGGNRAERRGKIRDLNRRIGAEQSLLERTREMRANLGRHLNRISRAQDMVEGVTGALRERYAGYGSQAREKQENAGRSQDESNLTSRIALELEDKTLRELAESHGSITNEQIGRLWNTLYPHAKLSKGYMTIAEIIRKSSPDLAVRLDKNDSVSIGDFLENTRVVFGKSKEFRALVEQATGQRGRRAIDMLVSRFETKLALTPNLQEL